MAAEVDQATAQEQIAPAQASSDAPQPPKAPEDAVGLKPPEDKAPGDKAVADAKFPDADGKNDDSAPQGAQAAPTEPAKAEDVVADTTTVGTAAGGAQQQDIAPKEDVPSVTGAASGDAPAQPPPSDLPAAPAADAAAKEPSAAEEKPAAAETNGAQKDADVGEQPPVPAPEEAVGAPASTGEKRKAEEEPVPTNGDAKKAKVDDANGAAAANGKPEAKKPGRPSKKDKKPVEKAKEAVGRTLRKTRSQGPIDQ